jgi:putative ABC transport system ATP-binding protein
MAKIALEGPMMPESGGPAEVERGAVARPGAQPKRFRLGFVFQKANLIPFLNARRNVELACETGERYPPRARARELLDYLGVGHRRLHVTGLQRLSR